MIFIMNVKCIFMYEGYIKINDFIPPDQDFQ